MKKRGVKHQDDGFKKKRKRYTHSTLTTTQASADLTLALTATIANALTEGLELKAPVDWVIKEGNPNLVDPSLWYFLFGPSESPVMRSDMRVSTKLFLLTAGFPFSRMEQCYSTLYRKPSSCSSHSDLIP